jgi:hypothetical protein
LALNDVYVVTLRQIALGQRLTNVFFYEQFATFTPTAGTVANDLAQTFNNVVVPVLNNIQTNDVANVQIDVENLFVGTDVGQKIMSGGGASSTNTVGTFTAVGYKLAVPGKTTRAGAKRIGPVGNNFQTDGVFTDATFISAINALEPIMSQNLAGLAPTTANVFRPVVVKRIKELIAGKTKYRLPNLLTEKTIQVIVETIGSLIMTTQNSRKVGRGD